MKRKPVYTTGEAAKICHFSQQTIIRCFENGTLTGFRIPGSKFRRIPHDALATFMDANGIPKDGLMGEAIRVLVVDDDPPIVELFAEALGTDGRFEVHTAGTGFDAGLMTENLRPDVLVMDYKLPDIDGHLVCQRIRGNPGLARTRILLVSGTVNPAEVGLLKRAGADEFIRKPFNVEFVKERILALVRS
ncbi:MAG: response regulator [Planctomycetota bacterium]|nr:response regulator [Planctomycetota bacterium]